MRCLPWSLSPSHLYLYFLVPLLEDAVPHVYLVHEARAWKAGAGWGVGGMILASCWTSLLLLLCDSLWNTL